MTIYGRSEELVSRCVECDLAEPESLTSLDGSAPGVVDGKLLLWHVRELDLAMCVSPSSNGTKMRSLWTNQMKS